MALETNNHYQNTMLQYTYRTKEAYPSSFFHCKQIEKVRKAPPEKQSAIFFSFSSPLLSKIRFSPSYHTYEKMSMMLRRRKSGRMKDNYV